MSDYFYAGDTIVWETEVLDRKGRPQTPRPNQGVTLQVRRVVDGAEADEVLPEGSMSLVPDATGTSTGGGTDTQLVDTSKNWVPNEHAGRVVRITAGSGVDQEKRVKSNTETVLVIDTEEISLGGARAGPWLILPDATSQYVIHSGLYRRLWATPTSLGGEVVVGITRAKDDLYVNAEKEKVRLEQPSI